MDRLDVSFHYGNMTKNNSDNYWLQSVNNVDNFRPSGHFDGLYSGFPGKASFFRTIQTSVQINSAFLKNHVLLGAEWSRTVEDNRFLISIPIPPIYYTFVPGEVATTGWAAYASVHISSIRRFDWKSRINVLFPKIKYDIDYLASNISVVEYKCVTGWQNNFKFGGFYAQINAMLGIKRGDIPANPPTPFVEGATDFILNYIMLGHSLYNDKLNVFVHARNLLGTSKGKEYYGYNTYIGAGIQLAFR
jgi:hypothetical protein